MSRRENDLRRELADHVDRLTADLVAQGHAPEEARRIALAEFGSVAAVADHVRDVWWTRRWREAAADIRHACRLLMRSPGFAVSSVLTLALAIGATLALLGLVDKLIFRRLPLDHASRLVQLGRTIGDRPAALSLDAVIHLRDNLTTVDGVAGHAFRRRADIPFSDMGYEVVTPEFHRLIGARAALGRTLEPEDDGKAVTVLSYACWMTKWGGARDVIGKTATIAGRPYTIVGVTARDFTGILPGVATYYTIPLTQAEARANGNFLSGVARRKAGIGLPAVRAEAESAWSRWIAAQMATSQSSLHHQRLSEQRVEVADASAGLGFLRREFSTSLYVLLAACALVLLLACVNLSNLLLSRGVARSHEFAVRLALGAPVARIVRQLLHESALLGMLGWLCAIPVSALVARAISNAIAEAAPGVRFTLQTDGRLLLLSLPLALLTTFAFGVMPAFRASRFAVKRQHGSAVSGGRLPDALIAVQVTLAVVLLATAALFVRTLHNYATAAAQLRTESVVLFTGEADPSDIRHRILDLPGVISASHVRIPPFADASWTGDPVLEGYSPKPGENISVSLNEAGPGYFAVLGTGIVEGREFTESDRVGTRRVAVVNRAFARRYSEGRSVVGRFLAWGNDRRFEIVGVAADAPQESLRTPPQPTVFFAALQGDGSRRPSWTTVVRTSGTAAPVIHGVRQMLGPDRVLDVRTSQDQVDRKLIRERLLALFASTLGAVATALTALGIHALLAFRVARRRAEIGIRMALGASPLKAAAMILGALLPPVAAGVVIGIGGALACAHLLRSLLFGFAPEDPPTYAAAALVAVGVAAAGGALAAARAASIDPAVALRCE